MARFIHKTSIALAVLLILNLAAFAQQTYDRSALWNKEIQEFLQLDKTNPPKKKGVLLVGSSSIRMWRKQPDPFPHLPTINRGFGGSHIEDVLFYAPQIVLPYKPKLIVLYAGENDITAGKSVEQTFADLQKFTALISKKLPKTRIIFISAKPSPSRWNLREKFEQFNALMKAESVKDKRWDYADVWTPMLATDGSPPKELFISDQLHMQPAGYEIWRTTLLPHITRGYKGNFR